MPTLVIPKTYRDGKAPRVSDLDNIRLSIEAFFNSTKLDADNISLSAISAAVTASQSRTLITSSEIGQITSQENIDGSVISVTIADSGLYAVYFSAVRSVSNSNIGSGDASGSSSLTFQINGITEHDMSLSFSTKTNSGLTTLSYYNQEVTPICLVRSFTQGDVLTLSGYTDVASLSVIKLMET